MLRGLYAGTAAVALVFAPAAPTSGHTFSECREGGEFIRNAALARNNGMAREEFLERLAGDFVLIRAYPPELRWFARDGADEAFLAAAVARVFDAPQRPAAHESEFLIDCTARAPAALEAARGAAADAAAQP